MEERMSHLPRRFRSLRWRLTLSYAAVTLVALISLEVAFVIVPGIVSLAGPQRPAALLAGLERQTPRLVPYLERTPPDRAGLSAYLSTHRDPILISAALTDALRGTVAVAPGANAALLVIGADGQPLATLTPSSGTVANASAVRALPAARSAVTAALAGRTNTTELIQSADNGLTVAAAPITDTSGRVRGALLLAVDLVPLLRPLFATNLLGLLASLIPFTLLASVLGTLFGVLTARGLTRRLDALGGAADAWSQGDFAVAVRDPTEDELGQLARHLNGMAEQIQTLLSTRKELAVVEERNRLARDLHDSVKQQIFAASMQIAAARALVRRDPAAAEARLGEVERTIAEAQRELTDLIRELRPAALANKGLVPALRDYSGDWSRRSGITAEVYAQGERPVPLDVEQALFRVAQEALANIARHSGATHAEVRVSWEPEALRLAVSDDGRGFDAAAAEGKGVGLQSMRERIEAIGGTLAIRAAASGRGTCVEACVPLARLAVASTSRDAELRDNAQV
jgi:two-component system, NarL family, sensor histidine kinase LiaS